MRIGSALTIFGVEGDMMKPNKKKKIKLKHPVRLFVSALVLVGIVFGAVWLIQNIMVSDPLVREIEQQEGQDIVVIDRQVLFDVVSGTAAKDDTAENTYVVQPDTVISYRIVYIYKIANNQTNYVKYDDLNIKISDTALATIKSEKDSQIVISNAPSDNNSNKVTVTVGYGKTKQVFTYNIDFSSMQTPNQ